eukprot:TRINITY_DN9804_c0_g2_i4.p1 TRINITY_DN9804_c0_g2~~TRINITY_DN9804_c0_g2_i4.p1  ORF type:complete len:168 (-),score=9.68 TRINITY_DN9804_c0_g2_i4:79-582(-)
MTNFPYNRLEALGEKDPIVHETYARRATIWMVAINLLLALSAAAAVLLHLIIRAGFGIFNYFLKKRIEKLERLSAVGFPQGRQIVPIGGANQVADSWKDATALQVEFPDGGRSIAVLCQEAQDAKEVHEAYYAKSRGPLSQALTWVGLCELNQFWNLEFSLRACLTG